VGTNLEEYKFFRRLDPEVEHLTDEGLLARLGDSRTNAEAGDNVQFDPAHAVAAYRQARAARGDSTTAQAIWFAIMSDRRVRVPVMRLAGLQAAQTPHTYAYLFAWQSPAWNRQLGAGHLVEVPFVFGTLGAPDSRDLVPAGAPVGTLSEQMLGAWVAFAHTGNPRTVRLPDWEPYTVSRRRTMLLGITSSPVDAPYEAERRFWETHAVESAPLQTPAL
jgi:para-nitrobenzyl esterase